MVRASKKFVQKNCDNSLNIKYLTLKICRHLHPSICGGMLVTFLKKKYTHIFYIEILLGIKRPALQLFNFSKKRTIQRQHCFLLNGVDLPQTNRMGRFYTSEGMQRQHLQVMYACVCGVMSVRVRASVMVVMKEECIIK